MLHYQLLPTRAMVSAIAWSGVGGGGVVVEVEACMNWSVRPHISPHLLQPPMCSRSGDFEVSTTDSAAGGGMNWTVPPARPTEAPWTAWGTENMAKVAQNETKNELSLP